MQPTYRTILPARPKEQDHQIEEEILPKRRRIVTSNACQNCRLRKVGCDGGTPSCTECTKRNVPCVYSRPDSVQSLRQDLKGYKEIVDHLKTSPIEEATDFLRKLRSATDPLAVLASVKADLKYGKKPPETSTDHASSASRYQRLESELSEHNSLAYPLLSPLDSPTIRSLLDGISDFSIVYSDALNRSIQSLPVPSPADAQPTSGGGFNKSTPDINSKPIQRQHYCDDRLVQLRIGYWTTVAISDEQAAQAISVYLRYSHVTYGFFDTDLFLDDLISHRQEFCSAFLVNSLLAYACQACTAIDPYLATLSRDFLDQAEIMRRAEQSSFSILTIAATNLLSLACHVTINHEPSMNYISDLGEVSVLELLGSSRRMCETLYLFGQENGASSISNFQCLTSDWKKATSHVAWGGYNWLTLNAYYFPLDPIALPPPFPVPGGVEVSDAWPPHPLPLFMGTTFTTICKFWPIMQEVLQVYSPYRLSKISISSSVPPAVAESKYQKLLQWMDTLQANMSNVVHNPDHAVLLRILFHSAVSDIFQPFVMVNQVLNLSSFSSPDNSILSLMRTTMKHLCQLVVEVRLHHSGVFSSTIANTAVMHLSNLLLSGNSRLVPAKPFQDREANWQFYFLLCLACLRDFHVCFSVFELISRGVLAMAMRENFINGEDARLLLTAIKARGLHQQDRISKSAGTFFIDFNIANTNPDEALTSHMAESFEELAMFDDLTTGSVGTSTG